MKSEKLIALALLIFGVIYVLYPFDFSEEATMKEQHEKYTKEAVTVEAIEQGDQWKKKLVGTKESVIFHFKKEWIPRDKEHKTEINQVLKKVGDTTIIIDQTYRSGDDDSLVMILKFEHHTKKLQGKFISTMTFENTEEPDDLNWTEIPNEFSFEHNGQKIEVDSYSYGNGDEDLFFGIPLSILEEYNYQIDVLYTGLAVYEYKYIGDE